MKTVPALQSYVYGKQEMHQQCKPIRKRFSTAGIGLIELK